MAGLLPACCTGSSVTYHTNIQHYPVSFRATLGPTERLHNQRHTVINFFFISKHSTTLTTTTYWAIFTNVYTADLLDSLRHYVDFDTLVFDYVLADLVDLRRAIDLYAPNTQ